MKNPQFSANFQLRKKKTKHDLVECFAILWSSSHLSSANNRFIKRHLKNSQKLPSLDKWIHYMYLILSVISFVNQLMSFSLFIWILRWHDFDPVRVESCHDDTDLVSPFLLQISPVITRDSIHLVREVFELFSVFHALCHSMLPH